MKTGKNILSLVLAIIMVVCAVPIGANAQECEHLFTATSIDLNYLKSVRTCTDYAVFYKCCVFCGTSAKGIDEDAVFSYGSLAEHNYVNLVDEQFLIVPATCETGAIYLKSCNICGEPSIPEGTDLTDPALELYIEGEEPYGETAHAFRVSNALHHSKTIVTREPKVPTCTEEGYTEEITCAFCGVVLQKSETIEKLEHDYEIIQDYKAPTCKQFGQYGINKCSKCALIIYVNEKAEAVTVTDVNIEALGHIDENNDYICDRNSCLAMLDTPEPEEPTYYVENGYYYTVEDSEATIVGVDETISGDIVIPSTLGGYPVTSIGNSAFVECFYITSVTIPESVVTISDYAFAYCIALEEVVIPENVATIGIGAFAYCMSLEKFVIENSATTIGEYVAYTDLTVADGYTTEEWVEKYCALIEAENNGTIEDSMYDDILAITVVHEEPVAIPTVTFYSYEPSTAKDYAEANGIPFKNISKYEEETHTHTYGEWYTVTEATVFAEGEKRRDCECGEFETDVITKLENTIAEDTKTGVEITYTGDNFDSEVEIVVSENAVNANIAFADEYENYKAYDISLEIDGTKVQPNGYVTVKLPLPIDYNADTTVVYYVDNNGEKTLIESTVENGYVIFETNHFSEYVIVDESSKIETPTEPEVPDEPTEPSNPTDDCSCNCHAGGIKAFFFRILNFFQKLFGKNKICTCGVKH